MRAVLLLALCAVATSAVHIDVAPLNDAAVPVKSRFQLFKKLFKKLYNAAQELHAFEAFVANEALIRQHNEVFKAGNATYWLGHNEFSDLTQAQFKAQFLSQPMPQRTTPLNVVTPPTTDAKAVDWVAKGAVTPVKNQGQCGSCWAFSTTGALEGAFQIAGNPLTELSEQELVSCASSSGNQGCNGGLMDNAFEWVHKNGLCTEASYPYAGKSSTCNKGKCKAVVTCDAAGHDVPQGDEKALVNAIAIGPVSVAIEADKTPFQLYAGGVVDSPECGTNLDHGVLAVGFGADGGKDYYKVKNSWGNTWGESGYVRIVRNKNMCGIASSASYPTGVKHA